jgi:transcriptional regulator with XRE-family HTH domain
MMLGMSQEKLGDALGITFQQVQKYENGKNRVAASRLQHMSHILQAPVEFFFDGVLADKSERRSGGSPSPHDDIDELMATHDGLALAKAFMRIGNLKLRRRITELVKEIEASKE